MRRADKVFEGLEKWSALEPAERRFFILAWSLAPVASVLLRDGGFKRVLSWLGATRGASVVTSSERVSIERAESLVNSAFHVQLSRRTCLPQSVVQFLLHRRYGPPPKLVIGVRRDTEHRVSGEDERAWGLSAHAWVEASDGPARHGAYTPILAFTDQEGVWRARAASPNSPP